MDELRDDQIRVIVDNHRANRHVDQDLTPILEIFEVSENRIILQHLCVPLTRYSNALLIEHRVIVFPA